MLSFLYILIERCLFQSAVSIPFTNYSYRFCFVWLVILLSDMLCNSWLPKRTHFKCMYKCEHQNKYEFKNYVKMILANLGSDLLSTFLRVTILCHSELSSVWWDVAHMYNSVIFHPLSFIFGPKSQAGFMRSGRWDTHICWRQEGSGD